jgi:hypothetical protein
MHFLLQLKSSLNNLSHHILGQLHHFNIFFPDQKVNTLCWYLYTLVEEFIPDVFLGWLVLFLGAEELSERIFYENQNVVMS